VSVDDWPAQSIFPWGHYVSTLGADGDKQVETQVLLHEFGVSHESFSAEVMACLPPPDWKITPDIIAQRTDLRHLPIVSIDPPGCKDIDDALHCIRLPNGNLQVGVHIAGNISSCFSHYHILLHTILLLIHTIYYIIFM
jgi:exosome complex exonuclease DIS3/RRP44